MIDPWYLFGWLVDIGTALFITLIVVLIVAVIQEEVL